VIDRKTKRVESIDKEEIPTTIEVLDTKQDDRGP
jgi:hypothetical protein